MADITSGTVNATPMGDLWMGTVELANTADDGDNVGIAGLVGGKIAGIVYAAGVGDIKSSGTAFYSPIKFDTNSGTVTLGNSGTSSVVGSDPNAISNKSRSIFFVARSSTQ